MQHRQRFARSVWASAVRGPVVLRTAGLTLLTLSAVLLPTFRAAGSGSPPIKIAFTRSGDIYAMNEDGSNVTRLTNNPANDFQATWSPDRMHLAFVSDRGDGTNNIYAMDVDYDGSGAISKIGSERQLTRNSGGAPEWSPDGSNRIVFQSSRDGDGDIYVLNALAPDPEASVSRITGIEGDSAGDSWPTWSPDGAKVVFSSTRASSSGFTLFMADLADPVNSVHQLLWGGAPVNGLDAEWSPRRGDGTSSVALVRNDGNIWRVNLDANDIPVGSPLQLTSKNDSWPTWSPTAGQIVFGLKAISRMNADGSQQVSLAKQGERPAWNR
jgi:Tol biopolymer transport system component